MTVRVPWDRYEVALLFSAYERVVDGSNLNAEATKLSEILRDLATHRGVLIDDTFRNVNGMKMQLANVHFLFTDGKKGLSGASAMIRQMYELYETNRAEYQTILKEAVRMTGNTATSIEDAFFAYAKDRIGFPPQMLMEYLKKSAEYCHLKQPLLGMTDVKAIRNVQQKVAEGKLLRFKYGKDAQRIRDVTRLYSTFIESYREPKKEIAAQRVPSLEDVEAEQPSPVVVVDAPVESMPAISADADTDHVEEEKQIEESVLHEDTIGVATEGLLQVNFSQDSTYLFTKPISYTYKGEVHAAKSWNRIYVEICGLLFADHHDAFMGIMNGDIPGYSTLAFTDERNFRRMHVPKSFAPGYYLESNLDATSIVRKIRGLHQLFGVGDNLQITYQRVDGYQSAQPKDHREVGACGDLPIDAAYDWTRDGLLLVDFAREASYAFTQPDAYVYNGVTRRVNKWGKLYADLCGVLFDDYYDAFMGIMNGDVPGYNSLAFADEQHKSGMRVARCFAPGYYLESNNDATAILRRIRGLYQLFELGDKLKISYQKTDTKDGETPEKMPVEEWIIAHLKARGITHQDKRSWNGCLWIVGGHELDDFIHECKVHGYTLFFKPDGCKTYPDKAVWWTKDQPKPQVQIELSTGGKGDTALEDFRRFLLTRQRLAERTANNYCRSLRLIEEYMRRYNLKNCLVGCSADEIQQIIDMLMIRQDFVKIDKDRHHQFLAAMKQYLMFLRRDVKAKPDFVQYREATIKEAVIRVLTQEGRSLSVPEILQRIQEKGLYQFNSNNPLLMVYSTIRKSCQGVKAQNHTKDDVFARIDAEDGASRYYLLSTEKNDDTSSSHNEADAKLRDQVLVVAADAFPNGIRPGSIIDLNKLKRGYVSHYNEAIPENTDISSILIESGLRSGEKVYILTSEQKQHLQDLIAGIFVEGHRVIYYSELLLRHGELLESCHLFEASLMRTVFASLMPDAICKTDRMLADRPANEIEEVTRAFGEDLVVTYQQIKERCPYLTLDVIKWALSRSNRFVWSSQETFAQTDLIQLDSDEIQKVRQEVLPQMQANGYYSLAKLPLEESCAMNSEISTSAVRDAMFVRHMADQCDRNGLIATPKGIRATTAQLLEGWCKEQNQLTIAELEAYERELTGRHAVLGLWAACYNMVRVDHDHFVGDALIHFDVEEVDRAIALFVGNRIVPITAITSFTSFPEISGYTWNLYLVESFLRRFSRRFTIDGGPAQMSYVGGICPAEMRFESYEDRLAQAVIQDGISLAEDSIGRYMTEKKYILRRSDTVRKILSKALILNEQRGDASVRL